MTDKKLQLTMRSQSDLDVMMYEGIECLGIRLGGEDLYHFLTVSTASKASGDGSFHWRNKEGKTVNVTPKNAEKISAKILEKIQEINDTAVEMEPAWF